MRSILSRSVLIAGAFLLLHVGSARASSLEVQVPFPFTVNGQQCRRVTTSSRATDTKP